MRPLNSYDNELGVLVFRKEGTILTASTLTIDIPEAHMVATQSPRSNLEFKKSPKERTALGRVFASFRRRSNSNSSTM